MSTDTLNFDLHKTIRLLPGYDPFAQAGDCTFDEETAEFVIDFVQSCCTHVKGERAGTPLLLEPWQKAVFANLYGWKRPDGTRRYREALVFIPRGNSKTTMAAALVCVGLYLDHEPGAEMYSSAAERDQARLCFEMVTGMIRNEPRMLSAPGVELNKYAIVVGDKSYKALSAASGSKHGFNIQLLVNDELHAHKTAELTEVLMTGTGKRQQPLVVHLTTSDYEREGSICNAKHKYGSQVRDNGGDPDKPGYDPSFLPVIYEASREDDWTDPDVWAKANPNLGVSVPLDYLQRECKRAQEEPEYENTFKRLHLNIKTEQAFRWMPMVKWDACDKPIDLDRLKGQACWAGMDLATISDLAALVLAFPVDDEFWLLPFFWCPEDTAAIRERKDRQPYVTWSRSGLVELTPGDTIDYRHIRKRINELAKEYKFREIAFDPWNATTLAQQLGDEDGFEMVEFRQGTVSMNEPMKLLMRLVLQKKLRHSAHPVLRWNASNMAAVRDASDNLRPDKKNSADKIDGIVAAIMAVGRAWRQEGPVESPYDDRGFLTV